MIQDIYNLFLTLSMSKELSPSSTHHKNIIDLLSKKYDSHFNFYHTKSINHIIYNRKTQTATLTAKDIAVLIEDIEYLKRYYSYRNDHGKNQIKDRMILLLNFYAMANMLQYEYPCMVINNMEEIFKKRRKRITQGENSEESSSHSDGNSRSDQHFQLGKIASEGQGQQELELLQDLDWSDIVHCNIPAEKENNAQDLLDFDEQFSIYEMESKKTHSFFNKINKLTSQLTLQINFNQTENEKQVSYLILDFDDLDKERIVNEYKKLANKENIPLTSSKGLKVTKIHSLNEKRPLSSSITIDTIKQPNLKQKQKDQVSSRQSMLIGSRQQRDKQIKSMKKSSDFQVKRGFTFSEDFVINQNSCEQSPIHDDSDVFVKSNESKSSLIASTNETKKPQGQGFMKQSEILYNDYFRKEKYQGKTNNEYKIQLAKLKENPIELKSLLKRQDHSPEGFKFKKQQQKQQKQHQHKNQLPFYLKRVKSHEELKPFHGDKGSNKIKKKQ